MTKSPETLTPIDQPPPIDNRTLELMKYFKALNRGRDIPTNAGPMQERVVAAAIIHGVKKGEIEFTWPEKRRDTDKSYRVETDPTAKKVKVTVDAEILNSLIGGIISYLPGRVLPPVSDSIEYITTSLKRNKNLDPDKIPVWKDIKDTITEIYQHYQALPSS